MSFFDAFGQYDPNEGLSGLFGNGMPMPNIAVDEAGISRATRPHFFDRGGVGRNIAGYIGDALMQLGGMQPIYAPNQQRQQMLQYEEQQRQRKRAEEKRDLDDQWRFVTDHLGSADDGDLHDNTHEEYGLTYDPGGRRLGRGGGGRYAGTPQSFYP